MKILIVGSGGREHALAWKMARSTGVKRVYVAPGNAGTALEPNIDNVAIGATDLPDLADFAASEGIDLTVVGPEAPLVAGIVDVFRQRGLRCFGPTRAAARLEGSKAFCKDFMQRHGIPTARYATFTEPEAAIAHIRRCGAPIVVKADGLAAGKGVVVARSEDEAIAAVRDMMAAGVFGEAGRRVVVEEFLEGEEASFMVMADGENILTLATSQDHKPLLDGDRGPNTGGMGAYSPAPVVTPEIQRRILDEVIHPTIAGMASDGVPYTGFLYAGLMITPAGEPKVLEFNCRMGDPETQPILMRLRGDLAEMCLAGVEGNLAGLDPEWDPRFALGVVMAAAGYPGKVRTGDVIEGLPAEERDDLKVFHAGTRLVDGKVVTAGGRVLCVTALGGTVAEARRKAYAWVERIHWPGVQYRRDIGWRALNR
ncbi:phosphoribosylamine---glycine ligase [Methylomarinovum caldicuralii]|uniref:Phosphoribosylamine--glycine ligase n=1 Tax=Methylomarinovum caldicuralii TaxID=438856 RepID=A0AAU9C0T8_9GAMM|nr:phosphoribosylamine--glycine ligase [Methylomarinovum caldicuralii]BCX80745.1 phosphoribosylamine---glycine ligase [Methylomarinovum caldicuralii]